APSVSGPYLYTPAEKNDYPDTRNDLSGSDVTTDLRRGNSPLRHADRHPGRIDTRERITDGWRLEPHRYAFYDLRHRYGYCNDAKLFRRLGESVRLHLGCAWRIRSISGFVAR